MRSVVFWWILRVIFTLLVPAGLGLMYWADSTLLAGKEPRAGWETPVFSIVFAAFFSAPIGLTAWYRRTRLTSSAYFWGVLVVVMIAGSIVTTVHYNRDIRPLEAQAWAEKTATQFRTVEAKLERKSRGRTILSYSPYYDAHFVISEDGYVYVIWGTTEVWDDLKEGESYQLTFRREWLGNTWQGIDWHNWELVRLDEQELDGSALIIQVHDIPEIANDP